MATGSRGGRGGGSAPPARTTSGKLTKVGGQLAGLVCSPAQFLSYGTPGGSAAAAFITAARLPASPPAASGCPCQVCSYALPAGGHKHAHLCGKWYREPCRSIATMQTAPRYGGALGQCWMGAAARI